MNVLRLMTLLCALMVLSSGFAVAFEGLRYAGATTLQRFFMPEIANSFTDATAIKVSIKGGNTTPGISALLKGEIDIAGAGRHLTDKEKQQGLVEHFLGWDTLAIVVHESNSLKSLTLEQLQGIFSGSITNWKEVGGEDQPIVVVTSPRGSGMRNAVQKLILKDKTFLKREIVSTLVAEADYQVSLFKNSITALSHSMLDVSSVKAILVNDIRPTAENIKAGTYPLAKPLALVTNGPAEGDVARFMELVFSKQGRAILQRSFVPVQ